MATERTLSIIKPDGLEKGIIGKIITRFEENGLKPVAMRMQHLSQREAEGFYAVHKARPFFKDLVTFMTSGPVVLMVLEGENAIAKNREVMGATNPANAAPGPSGRTSRPTWRRTPSTAPTARRTRRSRSPTSSGTRNHDLRLEAVAGAPPAPARLLAASAGLDGEAERIPEPAGPVHRDPERACPGLPPDPAELQEPLGEADAEGSGKVVAPLGPVQAGAPLQQPVRLLEQPERTRRSVSRRR
jgi:nucleoside diphosphate kinase